jgi:hypothetical protein
MGVMLLLSNMSQFYIGMSSRLQPIGRENLPLLLLMATHHDRNLHERFRRSRACRYSIFAPYRNESVVMFDEMVWHVRNNSFVCHHHPRLGARRNRLPSQLLTWNSTVNGEPICAAGFFDPSLRQSETLIVLGLPKFNAIYVRAKRYLVTCCYSGLLQRCEPGPAIDNLCSIGARVIWW